jgi:hypothetical protein
MSGFYDRDFSQKQDKREGADHSSTTVIKLRYSSLEELLILFDRKGFIVKEVYGDLDKKRWEKNGLKIVMVCVVKE